MPNLLDGEIFSDSLYNKFPSIYRQEDMNNNMYLKKYINSLCEGGFSPAIEDINGLTTLVNPSEADEKVLPFLYESYGVSVFNGLPVKFLRSLFPYLNNLFSRKGSSSVISFISSVILGATVTVEPDIHFDTNHLLHLLVDVDSRIEDDFPKAYQLKRILGFFLPFFCNIDISYEFYDTEVIDVSFHEIAFDFIREKSESHGKIFTFDRIEDSITEREGKESCSIIDSLEDKRGILNSPICNLNQSFYLSQIDGYDIITKGKEQITVFY